MGPQLVVDYYWVSITPISLSHPVVNSVATSPWSVTIGYNMVYTVNITAVNCAGQSGTLSLENIEYSKWHFLLTFVVKYNSCAYRKVRCWTCQNFITTSKCHNRQLTSRVGLNELCIYAMKLKGTKV